MRAKASVRKIKPKHSAAKGLASAKSSRDKVRAYRKRMRAKGLRLVQMWLPDVKTELTAKSITTVKRAWAQALAFHGGSGRSPSRTSRSGWFCGWVDSDLADEQRRNICERPAMAPNVRVDAVSWSLVSADEIPIMVGRSRSRAAYHSPGRHASRPCRKRFTFLAWRAIPACCTAAPARGRLHLRSRGGDRRSH